MKNIEGAVRAIHEGVPIDFYTLLDLIECGYNEELDRILSSNKSLSSLRDPYGTTLLMKSIEQDKYDTVYLLLKHGFPVDERDNRGFTALHFAVLQKSISIVNLLLDFGADIDKKSFKSKSPLLLSLSEINHTTDVLVSRGANLSMKSKKTRLKILIRAAVLGHTPLIDRLLKMDIYIRVIDEVDEYGKTALMYASENGYRSIVEIFLDNNASMIIRDRLGRDAYFIAAQNGHLSTIKAFIKHGYQIENINLTDSYGLIHPNAIFAAIGREIHDNELIITLISNTSVKTLKETDLNGDSIFHILVARRCIELINSLVFLKTDIYEEVLNLDKKTPMDIAFENNDIETASACIIDMFLWKDILENRIRNLHHDHVATLLKHGHSVEIDHIHWAINLSKYDSEAEMFNENLWTSVLGMLLIRMNGTLEDSIYAALEYAILNSRFKVIEQIYSAGYSDLLYRWAGKNVGNTISRNVMIFLKRFIAVDTDLFTLSDSSYLKYDIRTVMININTITISSVLNLLINLRLEGVSVDNLFYNGESFFQLSIKYAREDLAVLLLQYGAKPLLDERYENFLLSKRRFSQHLKNIYLEINGGGFRRLQQIARLNVISNLKLFHVSWPNKGWRKLLRFKGKLYSNHFIENNDVLKLCDICTNSDKQVTNDPTLIDVMYELKLECNNFKPSFIFKRFLNNRVEGCLVDLFAFIENGDLSVFEQFLQSSKINVNDFFGNDINPLHFAIIMGGIDNISLLLKYGAINRNTKCNKSSCVDLARASGNWHIVDYLTNQSGFKKGEEVNGQSYNFFNSRDLKYMSFYEFMYILIILKVKGFCVHDIDDDHKTMLQQAIENKREDFAIVLLQHGARPNLQNKFENTIKLNFTEEFNDLYKESKGIGNGSLEATARIAVRRDLNLFNEAWKIKEYRDVLKFRSKSYDSYWVEKQNMIPFDKSSIEHEYAYRSYPETFKISRKLFLSEFDKSTLKVVYANYWLKRKWPSNSLYHIFEAIENKDLVTLTTLIKAGQVDINSFYDGLDWNALHFAIINDNVDAVELLLQNGSLNLRTKDNALTCVELANILGYSHIVKHLRTQSKFNLDLDLNVIEFTSGIFDDESFREFQRQFAENKLIGCGIDDYLVSGENMLEAAIWYGRGDIATYLLEHNAKPIISQIYENMIRERFSKDFNDLYDESKKICVQSLKKSTRYDLEQFIETWKWREFQERLNIRSNSYNINVFNKSGKAELLFEYGLRNFLKSLLSGADLNHMVKAMNRMKDSETKWSNPLYGAIENRNCSEIRTLVESRGINVNGFYRNDALNALHFAIILGDIDVIRVLLKFGGVDLPIAFTYEIWCIELAEICGHYEVVKLLTAEPGFRSVRPIYLLR